MVLQPPPPPPIRPTGGPPGPSGRPPIGPQKRIPETHGESVRETFRSVHGNAMYASGKAEQGLRYLYEKCGKGEVQVWAQHARNYPKQGAQFQDNKGNDFTLFYDPNRGGFIVKAGERPFGG